MLLFPGMHFFLVIVKGLEMWKFPLVTGWKYLLFLPFLIFQQQCPRISKLFTVSDPNSWLILSVKATLFPSKLTSLYNFISKVLWSMDLKAKHIQKWLMKIRTVLENIFSHRSLQATVIVYPYFSKKHRIFAKKNCLILVA